MNTTDCAEPITVPMTEQHRMMTLAATFGLPLRHYYEDADGGYDIFHVADHEWTEDDVWVHQGRWHMTRRADGRWEVQDAGRYDAIGYLIEPSSIIADRPEDALAWMLLGWAEPVASA